MVCALLPLLVPTTCFFLIFLSLRLRKPVSKLVLYSPNASHIELALIATNPTESVLPEAFFRLYIFFMVP